MSVSSNLWSNEKSRNIYPAKKLWLALPFFAIFQFCLELKSAEQLGKSNQKKYESEGRLSKNGSLHFRDLLFWGLEHSPQLKQVRNRAQVSQLEESYAWSKFFPSLDLVSRHGILDSSPRVSNSGGSSEVPWLSEVGLQLNQKIYDNGESLNGYRIAKVKRELAHLEEIEQRDKFILDVVVQFLRFSISEKRRLSLLQQMKSTRKYFDKVRQDYDQGFKTKKDLLRFQAQMNRFELDYQNSLTAAEKDAEEVLRIVGWRNSETTQFADDRIRGDKDPDLEENSISLLPLEFSSEGIVFSTDLDWDRHFQVRARELKNRISELQRNQVARRVYPEWNLTAGWNYGTHSYLVTTNSFSNNLQASWNVVVSAQFNLWDWGARRSEVQVAGLNQLDQNLSVDRKVLDLKSEIYQLLGQTKRAEENHRVVAELLQMEKSNLDFLEKEYRVGKILYLDYISALVNFRDAELRFLSSLAELETQRYTWLFHQGSLYEYVIRN